MLSRRSLLRAVAGLASAQALSALAQGSSSAPTTAAATASPPKPDFSRTPGAHKSASPKPRSVFGSGATRIALVLEAADGPFGRASQPVLAGLKAAHARDGDGVTVEVHEIGEHDDVGALVAPLAARGVSLAIGPLTRRAVDTLADRASLPMPVVVLNQPDPSRSVPRGMVVFGLPIEAEARQIAQAAFADAMSHRSSGAPRAAQILDATAIGHRSAAAFAAEWQRLGGVLTAVIETDARTPADLRNSLGRMDFDLVFAAVDADGLRTVRGAIPPRVTVYGTSRVTSTFGAPVGVHEKLSGVKVVEMPWQLQPDSESRLGYPKARGPMMHRELQRLYALGIDAYRIASELLAGRAQFDIDGVTGRLRADLGIDARIERASVLAEYRSGALVPVDSR